MQDGPRPDFLSSILVGRLLEGPVQDPCEAQMYDGLKRTGVISVSLAQTKGDFIGTTVGGSTHISSFTPFARVILNSEKTSTKAPTFYFLVNNTSWLHKVFFVTIMVSCLKFPKDHASLKVEAAQLYKFTQNNCTYFCVLAEEEEYPPLCGN